MYRVKATCGTLLVQKKNYIIGVVVFLAFIVCVPVLVHTSSAQVQMSQVQMSWPPPEIEVGDNFDDFVDGIDTDRSRQLLGTKDIITGVTILQKVDIQTQSDVPGAETDVEMSFENEAVGTDLPTGGKKIEITTKHLDMSISISVNGVEVQSIKYDNEEANSDYPPEFKALGDLIGHKYTVSPKDA